MAGRHTNLRAALEHFEIQNKALAKALNIDPAQVSRWITGNRPLKVSAGVMEPLVDYILSRTLTPKDIAWLKKAFTKDGYDADFETVSRLKRTLILWLATDGEEYKRSFLSHPNSLSEKIAEMDYGEYPYSIGPVGRIYPNDYSVKVGTTDIALRFEKVLSTLEPGSAIDIYLSGETIASVIDEAIANAFILASSKNGIYIRCLISVSSNSFIISRILNTYLQPITNAGMEVRVTQGVMQPVIGQMTVIIPNICAAIISELHDSSAPIVSLFVTEEIYVKDSKNSFERVFQYAQPIVVSLNDNVKNMSDLFFREFAEPGDLDSIIDGLNPMYLSVEAYQAILHTRGCKGDAITRRCSDFMRIKAGMRDNLQKGAVFREIVPLNRLARIAQDKVFRISGSYFYEKSVIDLDAGACSDLLEAYIHYLNTFPNFHLMVADEINGMNEDCSWHIKQNRHTSFYIWKKEKLTLIYSDQLILTHEVQQFFHDIWVREKYSPGVRAKTIEMLKETCAKLAP